MLAKYLKEMRASKLLTTQAAAATLGHGWTVSDNTAKRDFEFQDFKEAAFFMHRYASYC